jgi:hypothetical protein
VDLLGELERQCVVKGWIVSVGDHDCCLCDESYKKELGMLLWMVCCLCVLLEKFGGTQDSVFQFFYKLSKHCGDRY